MKKNERDRKKNLFDGNLVFGAKKFHKLTHRSESQNNHIREEQKYLLKYDKISNKYIRKKNYWKKINLCPVCKSKKRIFFTTRYGVEIYECNICNHRYMDPIPIQKIANKVYNLDQLGMKINISKKQHTIDKKKFSYILDIINQYKKIDNESKILDLGCGSGNFLNYVSQKSNVGICVGVEISDEYSKKFNPSSSKIQYINSDLESINKKKVGDQYDCITLINVFEHLYNLDEKIISIHKLLKRNGILLIIVPNGFSMSTNLFRNLSTNIIWKHLNYFSINSINYIFKKSKLFKPVFSETIISEIENIKSFLNGKPPYSGYGDPFNNFKFITPEFIHNNKFGSRILAVFKKN